MSEGFRFRAATTNRTLAAVVTLALTGGCAPPSDEPVRAESAESRVAADPQVLIAADSAFDADVAVGGSEAWLAWFAEDGAMVQPQVGEVRGRANIAEIVAYLDQPGTSLRWTPLRADIATSGDLGWTTGTYVFEAPGPDGEAGRGTGVYVSIWRLQADGSWKVVMDLGNPTGIPGAGG